MKFARLVLAFTFAMALLVPRPAQAHVGWWDWLEELSGPGPFTRGWMADVRLFCLTKSEPLGSPIVEADVIKKPALTRYVFGHTEEGSPERACQANRTVTSATRRISVLGYVDVRAGQAWTDSETPLFQDRPDELIGTASVTMLQAFLMHEVHPALAVGFGGGALWFSGKHVTEKPVVGVVTPLSVAVMPLKLFRGEAGKWSGFVTVRFDEMLIMNGLNAHSFNPQSHSTFQGGKELVRSFAITFDLLAFK